MPMEIMEVFRELNHKELRKIIDRNTEWMQLVHGMLFYYGVLNTPKIKEFIGKYTGDQPDYLELFNFLYEASQYHNRIELTASGWNDGGVVDPKIVIREQMSRPTIDYYPFTKKQLIEASKIDYIEKTEGLRQFTRFLRSHYEITQEEVDDIVLECSDSILTGGRPTEIIEMLQEELEIPSFDVLNELAQVISAFYNDTRQWELKGYSPNELLEMERKYLKPLPKLPMAPYAAPTAMKKSADIIDLHSKSKVGRNDPCPCGSGQKFKKCCGK